MWENKIHPLVVKSPGEESEYLNEAMMTLIAVLFITFFQTPVLLKQEST